MADPAWTDVVALIQPNEANGSTTFTDLSSYAHTLTTSTSQVVVSSTRTKFAPGSVRFSTLVGNEFLTITATDAQVGTPTEGTWEIWLWADVISGDQPIVSSSSIGGISLNSNGSITAGGGLQITTAAGVFTAGAWHFLRYVKVGTTGTIYVDGVSKASGNCGANVPSTDSPLGGSNSATTGNFLYFGAVRYSRTAFQTTAFTPPTGPFPYVSASVGAASGVGVASGVGRATKVAAGASAATSAGTGVGKSTASAVATSAGAATASGTDLSTAVSAGASAAVAAASAVGVSTAVAAGSADGTATAAGVGSSTFTASGDAQGTAQAIGIAVGTSVATGLAAGVGAANGAAIPQMVGFSVGIGAALGVGSSTAMSVGLALAFGGAFGRGTLDAVFPRTLYAAHFGTPIGPNNDAVKVTRTINAARLGYPTAFWIDIS